MTSLYDYCKENNLEHLLQEWDYDLNKDINPHMLRAGSHKKVWWKCQKCKYSWETKIINRTHLHTGCPACAGSILLVGINDLVTKFPEIAKEWDYEKNANVLPQNVRPGSHQTLLLSHGIF